MTESNPTVGRNARMARLPERAVRQVLERWAWWRRRGRLGAEVGWSRKTLTGHYLDGMPGTNCPVCHGKGRIPSARLRIERAMLICPTCNGEGKVELDKSDPTKANPAHIRSTYRGHEDEAMIAVDRLVCDLRQNPKTQKHHAVLWFEYVSHKYETQDWKANRMGLKPGYYRKLLHDAHAFVESGLRASNLYLETSAGPG